MFRSGANPATSTTDQNRFARQGEESKLYNRTNQETMAANVSGQEFAPASREDSERGHRTLGEQRIGQNFSIASPEKSEMDHMLKTHSHGSLSEQNKDINSITSKLKSIDHDLEAVEMGGAPRKKKRTEREKVQVERERNPFFQYKE